MGQRNKRMITTGHYHQDKLFAILLSLYSRFIYLGRKFWITLLIHHLTRTTLIPRVTFFFFLPWLNRIGRDSRDCHLQDVILHSWFPLQPSGDYVTEFWAMEWGKSDVCHLHLWPLKTPAGLVFCLFISRQDVEGSVQDSEVLGMSNTTHESCWISTSSHEGHPLDTH